MMSLETILVKAEPLSVIISYGMPYLPTGLKSAGSYFQRVISIEVLGGLIGTAAELYLNDINLPI